MSVMQALTVAQSIAERHGDENWFRNDYTLLRENHGILASIEIALKSQDLWGIFVSCCTKEWFDANFGESNEV